MSEEEVLKSYYIKAGFNELLGDFIQLNETVKTLEAAVDERDNLIEKLTNN